MKKFNLILMSLALACLFLTSYSCFIRFFNISVDCAENVDTLRKVIAERTIYCNNKPELVIVGSSLTALFPSNYYRDGKSNLSIPGGSANTGLEILLRSNIFPKYLVVETNTVFIDADKAFLKELFSEPQYTVKKNLPIFQAQYRPINVILSLANQILIGDQAKNNVDSVDQAVMERTIVGYKKSFSIIPQEPQFSTTLERLKYLINQFQTEGSVIIFLEMPVHPELVNSPRQKYIREKITDLFPREKYSWICPAEQRAYEVTDGLHLLFKEGAIVNGFIDKLITEINGKG